jgi:hypothetical protein
MKAPSLLPALAIALGLVFAAPATPSVAIAADGDDEVVDLALVQLRITRNKKKTLAYAHMAEIGAEAIFTINDQGKRHQVAVLFDKAGERTFDVKLTYKAGGRKILSGSKQAAAKSWATFSTKKGNTVVSVLIDPDAKRADGLDIVETEDPIEGTPPKDK